METLTADGLSEMIMTWRRQIVPMPSSGRIIESEVMVDGPFEDWSHVRSPGRARRRLAKHRQNIRLYYLPKPNLIKLPDGTLVGHPTTVRELSRRMGVSASQKLRRMEENIFYGRSPNGSEAVQR